MHEGLLVGGRYRLGVQLGRGGMGRVFRASDERLRRDVAVKLVDLSQTTDKTLAERFRREAIATARLNHPGIVTIFDSGTDGRLAYLVMELLGGRPVADLLRERGRLSQREAVRIGRRVAEALVAAHEIGVVHRDLKPANVMVDGSSVKLLDFGIAMVALDAEANLTAPATALGTAAYMSPEQAQGFRASPASDVYGLGGVLVSMLTGEPPYAGDNAIQVAHLHLTQPAPSVRDRVPGIAPALDDLVTRMMAKDAAARPTAAVVAAALAHLEVNPAAEATSVIPVATPAPGPATPPATLVEPVPAAASMNAPTASSAPTTPMRWGPPPTSSASAATVAQPAAAPVRRPDAPAATLVQPAATLVQPAATLVQPATWGQPAATAQLPSGNPVPSAYRVPSPADPGADIDAPDERRFGAVFGRLTILILALLLFGVAWAVGTNVARSAPKATLPSILGDRVGIGGGGFGLPSMDDLPLLGAIAGVDAVLATLPTDTAEAEQAAKAIKTHWGEASDKIRAGESPARALTSFRKVIDDRADSGELGVAEATALRVALAAVEGTLG